MADMNIRAYFAASEENAKSNPGESDAAPAALVIGAGIAGIQAALDIAEAGFKVYLVEKEPSIGGHMARLDKTFPTLDCAACILTSKMVEVDRHPNIELMTYSEVTGLEGLAGHFKVTVRKKPRYVEDNCTSCGDCTKECPEEVLSEFDAGMGKRKAIYLPFPQAVPSVYVIDKRGTSPCKSACPVGVNVQGYVALISQGKFGAALELVRKSNPFPAVCGRVCHHPCETDCNRGQLDEPLAIAALKRAAADYAPPSELLSPAEKTRDEEVAIIGAGPAGLTAAYDLVRLGYGVTVFEALPVAGGMLATGIPGYRLPRQALQADINYIRSAGVEIRTNTAIGQGLTLDDLLQSYDAVFIGVGAHKSRKMFIPGEDLEGVLQGVAFLRDLNLGKETKVKGKVAVIGGGNVAIDAARSARRLGCEEVFIVYRRSRAEMPASEEEIEEAEEEGVKIHYLTTPTRILSGDGKVIGLECVRMRLGEPDESGRRRPIPIEGSEFTVDADIVILAIGQAPDRSFLQDSGLEITKGGTIAADPHTLTTNREGVFAGGDAVSGPATVIEAIAAGKKAAMSIHRYLRGEEPAHTEEILDVVSIEDVDLRGVGRKKRQRMPKLPVEERIHGFEEVELGFTEEIAIEEAKRCLSCGVCSECMECEKVCKPQAINHGMAEETVEFEVGAVIVATGFEPFDPRLKPEFGYQVYEDVITGLEFERLSSPSGPTQGRIQINGKKPKDVVFIKCVGSRDKNLGNEYCSRVCCMYTAKQAYLVKEQLPEARVTIFYTDVRAFGKGFEEFCDRVRGEGVIYRRGNASEVYRRGDKLIVRAEDTLLGQALEVEADLVVLATGLVPRGDSWEVADLLKLSHSADGFFLEAHPKLRPVDTAIEGLFLAGCCQGPKDISDTVAQAKAAASSALIPLSRGKVKVKSVVSVVDEQICSGCGICERVCAYSALSLHEWKGIMTVNDVLCQGCGACAAACPCGAITLSHFTHDQILAQLEALV